MLPHLLAAPFRWMDRLSWPLALTLLMAMLVLGVVLGMAPDIVRDLAISSQLALGGALLLLGAACPWLAGWFFHPAGAGANEGFLGAWLRQTKRACLSTGLAALLTGILVVCESVYLDYLGGFASQQLAMLAALAVSFILGLWLLHGHFQPPVHQGGLCRFPPCCHGCGYNLRMLTADAACPECGRLCRESLLGPDEAPPSPRPRWSDCWRPRGETPVPAVLGDRGPPSPLWLAARSLMVTGPAIALAWLIVVLACLPHDLEVRDVFDGDVITVFVMLNLLAIAALLSHLLFWPQLVAALLGSWLCLNRRPHALRLTQWATARTAGCWLWMLAGWWSWALLGGIYLGICAATDTTPHMALVIVWSTPLGLAFYVSPLVHLVLAGLAVAPLAKRNH